MRPGSKHKFSTKRKISKALRGRATPKRQLTSEYVRERMLHHYHMGMQKQRAYYAETNPDRRRHLLKRSYKHFKVSKLYEKRSGHLW
jgi:hypothetical protein